MHSAAAITEMPQEQRIDLAGAVPDKRTEQPMCFPVNTLLKQGAGAHDLGVGRKIGLLRPLLRPSPQTGGGKEGRRRAGSPKGRRPEGSV